jgi:zinc transport system substrate-binding protein
MKLMLNLLAAFLLLAASAPGLAASQLRVAAATGWAAAFAKAAGAEDVQVIAPENLQHPPDYDPKPSDLLRLRNADFIIIGGFEGFISRLREAADSQAKLVEVHLLNTPEVIRQEIRRLAKLFGTEAKAEHFLQEFGPECDKLQHALREYFAGRGRRAAAQIFMTAWADFAGLELIGTFGPGPLQPGETLRLALLKPDIILDNAHMPAGSALAEASGAKVVRLINFPKPGMELLEVFQENVRLLTEQHP